MRATFWVFLGLALGCSDPPVNQGCTYGGQSFPVGGVAESAVSCQACRCVADGELDCVRLPNCTPGDLPPEADAFVSNAGGAPGPDGPAGGAGGGGAGGNGAGGAGGNGAGGFGRGAGAGGTPVGPGCPQGAVNGLACAPDGSPIAGARIHAQTTDCNGNRVERETVAQADGHFRLDALAPGPTTVFVTAGRFDGRYDVVVLDGRSVPLDARGGDKECLPPDSAEVAAITGDYDDIERIVGALGFEYTAYCGDTEGNYGARALLGNYAELSRHDVVLINCGETLDPSVMPEGQQIINNLRQFVAEGGALYLSDLAANLMEEAWPDKVRFASEYFDYQGDECCTCINCPARCGANPNAARPGGQCQGTVSNEFFCGFDTAVAGDGAPGRRRGQILDARLQQFVGRDTLDINFELGDWMRIIGVGADVQVLVADGREPLMVMFTDPTSGGRVAYTTFHNEAQATADVQRILTALLFQL